MCGGIEELDPEFLFYFSFLLLTDLVNFTLIQMPKMDIIEGIKILNL